MDDAPSHYEYSIPQVDAAKVKDRAFGFMSQLDGWCSNQKAGILIDLILKSHPETIVEIGVWGGKSLVPMATALKANGTGRIYGIDPWDSFESLQGVMHPSNLAYWGSADHDAVMHQLMDKLNEFHLTDFATLIRSTSVEADPIEGIDILHVDGNHSDETSYLDVTKWVPLVNHGGWVIFDDIGWYENGVFTNARAVEWLDATCSKFGEFKDNCTWGIWIKP